MENRAVPTKDAVTPVKGAVPWPLATAMGVLPLAPLEIVAGSAMRAVLRRNPGMLSRLGEHAAKRFAIDPVDCPFVFVLEPRRHQPRLRVVAKVDDGEWDARVAGAMVVLLGLLDNTYDGDALFFSRDLVIEGDTAAVLALRNAIEDADLDVGRLLNLPDRLAPTASGAAGKLAAGLRAVLGAPSTTTSVRPESF